MADPTPDEKARQEQFVAAWSELIGLYRVLAMPAETAGEVLMRVEAESTFNRKAHQFGVTVTAQAALRMKGTDVIDAIAPMLLLKPAEGLPTGAFGPMVTAESPEDLKEQMRRLRNDPRIAALMSRSGYLSSPSLV